MLLYKDDVLLYNDDVLLYNDMLLYKDDVLLYNDDILLYKMMCCSISIHPYGECAVIQGSDVLYGCVVVI